MTIERRVVVDALAARFGGTAYAAVQVAIHLAESRNLQVVTVSRRGSIVAEGLSGHPMVRVVTLPATSRLELAGRLTQEATTLRQLVASPDARLLSWSGMLPRRVGHVTCYLANPGMFAEPGMANQLRRWAVRRTAGYAAHVVVPSEAMAADVRSALLCRVKVVPLGVDHARFSPGDAPGHEVLCVADLYPHKRHDLVLAAWAKLPAPRPPLRIIGDPAVPRSTYRVVAACARRYAQLGLITIESGLSLTDLIAVYRRARVLIMASEQESFAMPLLEAQACGTPAVARDLPALRATGGRGTLYVRGDAPSDWSAALLRLLRDDAAHQSARDLGLAHAARFSWRRTASELRTLLMDTSPQPTSARGGTAPGLDTARWGLDGQAGGTR